MEEVLVRREKDPDAVFGKMFCVWIMVYVCACTCEYEPVTFSVGMKEKQYPRLISLVSFGGCRMFIAGDIIVISCGKRLLVE